MQFDWITSPLTQCAFLALAMLGFLALFVSMKLEISVVRQAFEKSRNSAAPTPLEHNNSNVREVLESANSTIQTVNPNPTLDGTRRTQALQMQQLGESPAGIAATLGVPRNEIDLLLKIQRLAKVVEPIEKSPDPVS